MTNMDRNQAVAICFANLKGSKTKNLLLTARALKYLRNLPEFRSNKAVGGEVGVSGEIVRQFITLLDLPVSVQSRFAGGSLGLEQGRRLWQLARSRATILEDAAAAMAGMTAMETRDLVEYLIRSPSASIEHALAALDAAHTQIAHEYHIDAVLGPDAYASLQAHARRQKIKVNVLVTRVIQGWLERPS